VKLLAAAIALTVSTTAGAWTEMDVSATSDADNTYYYTMQMSDRYTNTILTLSAFPHRDCKLSLSVVTMLENIPDDQGIIDAKLDIRVDGGTIHHLDTSYSQDTYDNNGRIRGRAAYITVLTDNQASDIIMGRYLISKDPEENKQTDKFNLKGSSKAINDVITACRKDSEWGNKPASGEWAL
jgi:hypothetical protein